MRRFPKTAIVTVSFFLFVSFLRTEALRSEAATPITIASYNVENYLTMPRRIDGRLRDHAGKPPSEKAAVVRILAGIHPDVLGLMEMGDESQFNDLRRRLHEAGMDFPHAEYLQGEDPQRHIALLSRFPIIEHNSQGDLPLQVNGQLLHSPRGILDITIEPHPGFRLRIICLHLKAKLNVEEYDQGDLREAEAREVRRHVREILRADPEAHLLVMGDFNDSRNAKPIWEILGKPAWPDSLHDLPLADDRGERWTEYWKAADEYSRIDYIMVSKGLEKEIILEHSGIARPSFWNEGSDHCPVYTSLIPEKR